LAFIEGTIPVKGIHGFILYAGLPAAASLKHLEQAASGDCAAQGQIARADALQFAQSIPAYGQNY